MMESRDEGENIANRDGKTRRMDLSDEGAAK